MIPTKPWKAAVGQIYVEETCSVGSSNLDNESMISFLSNPVGTRSSESLSDGNMYETVDPTSATESEADTNENKCNVTPTTREEENSSFIIHDNSYVQTSVPKSSKIIDETKQQEDKIIEKKVGEFLRSSTAYETQVLSSFQEYKTSIVNDGNEEKRGMLTADEFTCVVQQKQNSLNKAHSTRKEEENMIFIQQTEEDGVHVNKQSISSAITLENSTSDKSEQDEYLARSLQVNRIDQFNKVSPFDDVPGFQRRSSKTRRSGKSSRRSSQREMNTSVETATETSRTDSPHTPGLVSRDRWITFDDGGSEGSKLSEANLGSSLQRKTWISFEEGDLTKESPDKMDEQLDASGIQTVTNENEKLIASDSKLNETDVQKSSSVEDLLSVVNKTVNLLKNSITNPTAEVEKKNLLDKNENNGNESDISDEIVSIDYDSEDDNKPLRDTPVKQFTDVTLFQASSAVKNAELKQALADDKAVEDPMIPIDEPDKPLDNYPDDVNKKSWQFWFRFPDNKKRVGRRKWLPVVVQIDGEFIKFFDQSKRGLDVLKEIPLHPFFVFTIPILHRGNKHGKMLSVKLQYVKYKETRKLKTRVLEHKPVYTPVLKLACRELSSLREFTEKVESIIRRIPTHRDKGITYRHEEIYIDCDDDCQFLLTGDGDVVKYNITVQLRLRVFITSNPELKLYLNDISYKDVLGKTKETLLRQSKTSTVWIRPESTEYHPCVDINKSDTEGGIIFVPPDGCSFELMRFRVRRKRDLPLNVKSSLELLSGNSVRLQASVKVCGDAKSVRHRRNDVVMFFPIPSSWSTLFVRSRSMNGTKKYIRTNVNTKTPCSAAVATLNRVTLQVSCGKAKYEPAYSSIVWTLGSLPVIQDGLAADATHTFQCFLELPFPLEIRDDFQPFSFVEFNVSNQLASGVSVEEILLSDGRVPEKWVCYGAHYSYKVMMTVIENGKIRTNSRS